MKKTIGDIFYNTIYQLLVVFLPFITIPYLSRVIGPDLIGVNNFIMSIIQFLGIIALVGLNQYGVRIVRQKFVNVNKNELSHTFFELYAVQLIFGVFTTLLYTFIFFLNKENVFYYLALLPYLLSNTIDISWFYQGIEKIRKVVFRNTIVKLGTLILIFVFVKSEEDFIVYLLIVSMGTFLGNAILWIQIKNYINFRVPKKIDITNHKKTIALLIPQVAIQVYIAFDTTLLGIFTDNSTVAYYSQSQRIIRIITTVLTSISVVMMPKMVGYISEKKNLSSILRKSYEFTLFFSLFFSAAIFVSSKEFVPWFFGNDYYPMIPILQALSILIVLIPIGGIFSNQLALALEEDKMYSTPLIIGAFLSLTLNLLLIPLLGIYGATMTSILIETIVCIMRIYLIRKEFDLSIIRDSYKYLIPFFCALSIGCLFDLDYTQSNFLNIIFTSLFIGIIYFIGILISKNEVSKMLFSKLKKESE